jgi:citrate synthase
MGTSTVAAVMTQPVITALPGETLREAAERMRAHGIGSLVVVEGDRPVGIVTERDLLRATAAAADPATSPVADWMVAEVECVHPDATVDQAWQQLADHGYRHIPVVVGDELTCGPSGPAPEAPAGRAAPGTIGCDPSAHVLAGIVSLRDLVALAHLRPADELAVAAPPGLKGVVVAETALGDVRGTEGFYHYRQYAAPELAETRTFEDVWRLLIDGELPVSAGERAAFAAEVAPRRALPPAVLDALPGIAAGVATPVAGLRTALSLLAGAEDFAPSLDVDRAQLRSDGLRVAAATPTIIAALHRLRSGDEPVAPRPDLGHAANYLYMLGGAEADPRHVRAIEQYLVLGIDHGFNASTFVARAVTSTGADLGAVVVAALGSLSGPLHGGSPSRALDTLDAIGSPGNAAAWVRDAVAGGRRIMGFGHAVYRTADPRSELLRGVVEDIGGELGQFAIQVESEVVRTLADLKPDRELRTNIEWYAAVTMDRCGLPRDLFTPTFAASRIVGWCAHALEQHADNRIIRPSSRYVGPPPPQPVPALSHETG